MNDKEQLLREFISMVLLEEVTEDLLAEPDDLSDEFDGKRRDEFAAGGVPGVITPLGTGPTYPDSSVRKKSRRKRKK